MGRIIQIEDFPYVTTAISGFKATGLAIVELKLAQPHHTQSTLHCYLNPIAYETKKGVLIFQDGETKEYLVGTSYVTNNMGKRLDHIINVRSRYTLHTRELHGFICKYLREKGKEILVWHCLAQCKEIGISKITDIYPYLKDI